MSQLTRSSQLLSPAAAGSNNSVLKIETTSSIATNDIQESSISSFSDQQTLVNAPISSASSLVDHPTSQSNFSVTKHDPNSKLENRKKNLKTEYKSNFTPFDQYVYNEVTDSFVKAQHSDHTLGHPNQASVGDHRDGGSSRELATNIDLVNTASPDLEASSFQPIDGGDRRHENEPWYKEVIKRNEKANEYRFKSEVGHNSPLLKDPIEDRLHSASPNRPESSNELRDGIASPLDQAASTKHSAIRFTPNDYKRDHLIAYMANNNNFNLPKEQHSEAPIKGSGMTKPSAQSRRAQVPTSRYGPQVRARSQSSRRQPMVTSTTGPRAETTSKSNQTTPTKTVARSTVSSSAATRPSATLTSSRVTKSSTTSTSNSRAAATSTAKRPPSASTQNGATRPATALNNKRPNVIVSTRSPATTRLTSGSSKPSSTNGRPAQDSTNTPGSTRTPISTRVQTSAATSSTARTSTVGLRPQAKKPISPSVSTSTSSSNRPSTARPSANARKNPLPTTNKSSSPRSSTVSGQANQSPPTSEVKSIKTSKAIANANAKAAAAAMAAGAVITPAALSTLNSDVAIPDETNVNQSVPSEQILKQEALEEQNLIVTTTTGGNMLADEIAQAEKLALEASTVEQPNIKLESFVKGEESKEDLPAEMNHPPQTESDASSLKDDDQHGSSMDSKATELVVNGIKGGLVSTEDHFDSSEREDACFNNVGANEDTNVPYDHQSRADSCQENEDGPFSIIQTSGMDFYHKDTQPLKEEEQRDTPPDHGTINEHETENSEKDLILKEEEHAVSSDAAPQSGDNVELHQAETRVPEDGHDSDLMLPEKPTIEQNSLVEPSMEPVIEKSDEKVELAGANHSRDEKSNSDQSPLENFREKFSDLGEENGGFDDLVTDGTAHENDQLLSFGVSNEQDGMQMETKPQLELEPQIGSQEASNAMNLSSEAPPIIDEVRPESEDFISPSERPSGISNDQETSQTSTQKILAEEQSTKDSSLTSTEDARTIESEGLPTHPVDHHTLAEQIDDDEKVQLASEKTTENIIGEISEEAATNIVREQANDVSNASAGSTDDLIDKQTDDEIHHSEGPGISEAANDIDLIETEPKQQAPSSDVGYVPDKAVESSEIQSKSLSGTSEGSDSEESSKEKMSHDSDQKDLLPSNNELLMNVADLLEVEAKRKHEMVIKSEIARERSDSYSASAHQGLNSEILLSADQLSEKFTELSTTHDPEDAVPQQNTKTKAETQQLASSENPVLDNDKEPAERSDLKSLSRDSIAASSSGIASETRRESVEISTNIEASPDSGENNNTLLAHQSEVDKVETYISHSKDEESSNIVEPNSKEVNLGEQKKELENQSNQEIVSSFNDIKLTESYEAQPPNAFFNSDKPYLFDNNIESSGISEGKGTYPEQKEDRAQDTDLISPANISSSDSKADQSGDTNAYGNLLDDDMDSDEQLKLSNHLTNSDDELILDPRATAATARSITSPLRTASPSRYNEGAGLGAMAYEERVEADSAELADGSTAEIVAPTTAENRVEVSTSKLPIAEAPLSSGFTHPLNLTRESDSDDDDDIGLNPNADPINVAATMSPSSTIAEEMLRLSRQNSIDGNANEANLLINSLKEDEGSIQELAEAPKSASDSQGKQEECKAKTESVEDLIGRELDSGSVGQPDAMIPEKIVAKDMSNVNPTIQAEKEINSNISKEIKDPNGNKNDATSEYHNMVTDDGK